MTLYVTFGLGSVFGHSFLVCHGPTEDVIRTALNRDGLKWAGVYRRQDFADQIRRHGLSRLPRDHESLLWSNGGPARSKQWEDAPERVETLGWDQLVSVRELTCR